MLLKNNLGFFEFSIFKKFPEIIHGISTKEFGNMKPVTKNIKDPQLLLKNAEMVTSNLTNFAKKLGIGRRNFVTPFQIHSGKIKKIEIVSSSEQSDFPFVVGSTDGLVTGQKGFFLFVAIADCFPILACDPIKKVVGIAHAGWRGIKAQIAKNLILKMKNLDATPANIAVGVGPGICGKCYEVKNDVASKFSKKFLIKRNEKIFLDLAKAIVDQLIKAGVKKENVETANICVFENKNFYSFRRERENLEGEQAAIIGLR